jgi:hypothetical protein
MRLLRPLAVGAAVAVAVVAGQKLLERRHGGDGDGGPGAGAKRASAKDATTDAAERPADLATELRSAAGELAVTLLDRATDRLERAKP